ncbi:NADPH-dependent F420 reductase [Microlunatus elymi]|nr:NAD(P)-binding domain-containing protein [Microlunatus elymi]
MDIAVIGTGKIGSALGEAWSRAGHQVSYGSRDPGTTRQPGVDSIAVVLPAAEVVILAQPGSAVADFVAQHRKALKDKIVIDAANRSGERPLHSRAAFADIEGVRYVRAFNTLLVRNFTEPLPDSDLFFAADVSARPIAEQLISEVGLRPPYVGGPDAADAVDGLLILSAALFEQRDGDAYFAYRLIEPASVAVGNQSPWGCVPAEPHPVRFPTSVGNRRPLPLELRSFSNQSGETGTWGTRPGHPVRGSLARPRPGPATRTAVSGGSGRAGRPG